MQYGIEPHRPVDRIRGKLLFLLAAPRLALAVLRTRRATPVWIGDSHAMSLVREVSNGMFLPAPHGQLVVRDGPRLMYSISRSGFGPNVQRLTAFVRRVGRRGALLPVFCAGEIDVRAHLAKREEVSFEFVTGYVQECLRVSALLRAERCVFAAPPPPVDVEGHEVWFPVVGSIATRVELHTRLRAALVDAVAAVPDATVIDFTDELGGAGGTPVEMTIDGNHLNREARARVRRRIVGERLLDGDGAGAVRG